MLAYLVCGSPGPSVLNLIVTFVLLAAGLAIIVPTVIFVGGWMAEKVPWLAFGLVVLLVVGAIGGVIGGVYVGGHPPECAKTDTCAVNCPSGQAASSAASTLAPGESGR